MRVLMAATEMYNMDNEVPLNSVDMDALVKGQYLKEPLTCPDGGTYSSTGNLAENGEIVCSIHNTVSDLKQSDTPEQQSKINVAHHLPDPRLQHIVRARMFVDTNGLLLAVSVKDETVRQQFKEILQQGFKALEQQLLQSKGDNETVKKMFAELNFIDQKPWLGFSAKQSEKEQVLVGTAIVGIIAAIAVPNFKKARFEAQKRACFANQRVLLGATEMYNMDNEVPLSGLNIKALLDGRYIKSAPKCPAGGVYSATGDLAKDGRIKCSVHGSVDW
jgi:competence protein ComGC